SQCVHGLPAYFDPGWVRLGVQARTHAETGRRGRGGNELDDDLVGDQRLPPPVLTDERKQAVFDLVPLARAGGKVTHRDRQSPFGGQLLQLHLPQSQPCAIAAAGIGGDQQPGGTGGGGGPPPPPPPAARLHPPA